MSFEIWLLGWPLTWWVRIWLSLPWRVSVVNYGISLWLPWKIGVEALFWYLVCWDFLRFLWANWERNWTIFWQKKAEKNICISMDNLIVDLEKNDDVNWLKEWKNYLYVTFEDREIICWCWSYLGQVLHSPPLNAVPPRTCVENHTPNVSQLPVLEVMWQHWLYYSTQVLPFCQQPYHL